MSEDRDRICWGSRDTLFDDWFLLTVSDNKMDLGTAIILISQQQTTFQNLHQFPQCMEATH